MTDFPSVWLSTDEQFEAFDEAFKSASLLRKVLGLYQIRKGAAYITNLLSPWMRIPIVMVAAGELDVRDSKISFRSRKQFTFAWRRKNLWSTLEFDLSPEQILAVENSPRRSPVSSVFELVWTRVRTSAPAPLDNFLVSVGGQNSFALPEYRKKSLQLRDEISSLMPGNGKIANLS
ncbi:MAG TPA: hypothetical protein VGH02_06270 [Rhizomicrobium sp.]|jgi:hypothetical protein